MNREIRTIKLSNCEVDVITFLTWAEKEKLEADLSRGLKMSLDGNKMAMGEYDASVLYTSKITLIKLAVKEIREGENKTQVTDEWINNLSIEDGDLLYGQLDELNKKKA